MIHDPHNETLQLCPRHLRTAAEAIRVLSNITVVTMPAIRRFIDSSSDTKGVNADLPCFWSVDRGAPGLHGDTGIWAVCGLPVLEIMA
jgi:hypothetical protein